MSTLTTLSERATARIILVALMLFTLAPLLSMLAVALAPQNSSPTGVTFPTNPQWGNFVTAWNVANFFPLFVSSVIIVLGSVPLSAAMATVAGFALAHVATPGRRLINLLFLLGLTLPGEALITPLYIELQSMGLTNTRWAIILPLLGLYMPFGVFWMRQQFLGLPIELTEAARIDGASNWRLFWSVQLPLARSGLGALVILLFLWTWNQFLLPLVMVSDPLERTMAGGLGAFSSQFGTNLVLLCAGSLLIIAPSLVIFLIFQRQFVSALLQGSSR